MSPASLCAVRPRLLALAVLTALAASAPASGQVSLAKDVEFKLQGTVQPRVSYATVDGVDAGADAERLGVGLRRARFQFRATYAERVGFEFDFDGTPGDVRAVDLYGFYDLSETLQVRAGRLPPAQPRAYNPTSHTRIDAVERAAISERWAGGTIGSSGRDFGLDLAYETDRAEAVLSVHSGTGSFSRGEGNFRESISASSVTRGADEVGLAVSGMASVSPAGLPGVEVGAFAGLNPVGSDDTVVGDVQRSYATGGAHLYWGANPGSQPVRIKLDALGIQYEEVGGMRQEAVGLSGFGAVGVSGVAELFGRYEAFWNDLDDETPDTYLTVGGSYSPSAARGDAYARVRLTLAYAYRDLPGTDTAHLAVVQGQFAF